MLINYLIYLSKYLILYGYLFLLGRSVLLILSRRIFNLSKIPREILYSKGGVTYPLIGTLIFGNLIFFAHFFISISSPVLIILLIIFIIPNIYDLNLNLKDRINFSSFFRYLIIPGILVISIWDTAFNYDAGYYHILNQAWFRESNLIIGMVNIFWPFGMSSIYEYMSAFLWIDSSFVLLHFIDLIFIHIFYIFIIDGVFNEKYKPMKFSSIFLLAYSILDNFGFSEIILKIINPNAINEFSLGGRNGYIYIQGVGKQDIPVAILFYLVSITLLIAINKKTIKSLDLLLVSLLIFFIYQLKVSGILVSVLYLVLIFIILQNKDKRIIDVFYLNIPVGIIGIFWSVKNIISSGCIVFPLTTTCFTNFHWYISGSTESYEAITTQASLAYKFGESFTAWVSQSSSFEFRKEVFLNFITSLFILFLIKKILFKKLSVSKNFNLILFSFIFFNFLYLLFFGPIPRYAVGICMVSAASFGFFTDKIKLNFSKNIFYMIVFISVFLLPRSNSYIAALNNDSLRIFDPRINDEIYNEIGFVNLNENWVYPTYGDQCWANLECTMAKENIYFEDGFFKVARK